MLTYFGGGLPTARRLGERGERERGERPPPIVPGPRRLEYKYLLNSLEIGFKCMKLQNPERVHSPISY